MRDAYEYQLEQVAEFSEGHGAPSRIEHMNAYLRGDAVSRLRYAGRKMRRFLWMGIMQLAALGCSLVMLFMFFLLQWSDPSKELVTQRFWALNLLIVSAAIISGVETFLVNRGSGQSSKETHRRPSNTARMKANNK